MGWLLVVSLVSCDRPPEIHALAETTPVSSDGDAADDAAIWVNPLDPAKSIVIGTDKRKGLQVYDLDGTLQQVLPDGRLNNVDLRDDFLFGDRRVALVAATNRGDGSITLYVLDHETRRLERAPASIPTGLEKPYGLCMYATPAGEYYVFASDADSSEFRQWLIRAGGNEIHAELVRRFVVGSRAEGCAADDETGALYVAEEEVGLWKYEASPQGGEQRQIVDRVGGASGLVGDLEGIAIRRGDDGNGFIVLSDQGASSYAVYRREGDNELVGRFRIGKNPAAGVDGTSKTDGLEVTSIPLASQYPDGLLVVQDDRNDPRGERQNFKFVSWRDVEGALQLPRPR